MSEFHTASSDNGLATPLESDDSATGPGKFLNDRSVPLPMPCVEEAREREARRIGPVDVPVFTGPEAIAEVTRAIERRRHRVFAFCNVHTLNTLRRSDPLRDALSDCTLFNDGVGMDVASRILHGSAFPENLNGTDFVPALLEALPRAVSVFILGGQPGVAEAAAAVLDGRYPAVKVVGTHDGYFPEGDSGRIAEAIRASGAELVLVGMGQPRQEIWAARHGRQTGAVMICVGALLDFVSGRVRRAPRPFRRLRLEWLYRLMREPRRLSGRYIGGAVPFGLLILRQLAAERSGSADPVREERD